MDMESLIYPPSFYDEINQKAMFAAHQYLDELWFLENEGINSIIDIGCGEGAWLAEAKNMGFESVRGIDGFHVQPDRLLISSDEFTAQNLEDEFHVDERFDLAISLEVAEHLTPEAGQRLVKTLCTISDRVLFSAAIPGQKGIHHINEQWQSYWADLFSKEGFVGSQWFTWRYWNDPNIENWYKQNIVYYAKIGGPGFVQFGDYDNMNWGRVLDIVHPNNWHDHYLANL